jgi:nucleotide-binding universal stress UspA family protein
MAYKDILVYLDPTRDTYNRVRLAASLASVHGARLVGMDVCSRWRDQAVGLRDLFEETIKSAAVPGSYFTVGEGIRDGEHRYARYVDLVVASQPILEADDLIAPGIPEDALVTAGVPFLLLPSGWDPCPVGENVVIAWKSSREAARAVHDSMPFLKQAKKVTVFTFAPQPDIFGSEPESLVNHLQQHGVQAHSSSWPNTSEMSAVEALFACLETQDADLIVSGAYGHSRLLEGLFGGASYDLARQPSFPVLMSH